MTYKHAGILPTDIEDGAGRDAEFMAILSRRPAKGEIT